MAMIPVSTAIEEVIVYPDRARITRRGEAQLTEGMHVLIVDNLPASLDPDSLRASGRGTARAKLLSVEIAKTFVREPQRERVAELEAKIEALADQDRELADREQLLNQESAFLASLSDSASKELAKGLAFARSKVSDIADLGRFLGDSKAKNGASLRELAFSRRSIERELDQLRRELKEISSPRPLEMRRAQLEVEVVQAGLLGIELTYVVSNASWRPLYDLRVPEEGELVLSYLGEVTQSTGEEWTGVLMSLSTAKPAVTGTLPELRPWYLEPLQPPRVMHAMAVRAAPAAPGAGAAMAMMEGMPAAELEEESLDLAKEAAEISRTGLALTYRLRQQVSVASDGVTHKVAVANQALPFESDYLSAPKLASYAFRRARVQNASEAVFLPGRVAIFWGGEYVGSSELANVAPGQEFEVFLGVDERVRIERELVEREVDRRLLGNRRRVRYAYRISAENLTSVAASLTLLDQVPVSRHEEVKVSLVEAVPTPDQKPLGILQWKLELGKGEKQEVRFSFTVEYPRDMVLRGLSV